MGMQGAGRRAWQTRRANDARADARAVLDLYRDAFSSPAKSVSRRRVIAALKAAGVTTVLDLSGGGMSALDEVAAGFRVISVDNGSMAIVDASGKTVSAERKKRALELAGAEGGYETRWGSAKKFAREADGAFLDFCGPWTAETRRVIEACRHMKVVIVTLMADHDQVSGATTRQEREAAYEMFLRLAFLGRPWRGHGVCRVLCQYRRPKGHPVWVFLVAPSLLVTGRLSLAERKVLDPAVRERHKEVANEYARRHRASMTDDERAAHREWERDYHRKRMATEPDYAKRHSEYQRHRKNERRATDPIYRERDNERVREWKARRRARRPAENPQKEA